MDTSELLEQYQSGNRNFRGARLQGARLQGARLWGADLQGADLQGANLRGANLNWTSHDLITEVLRQHATDDIQLAWSGFILLHRNLCWEDFQQRLPADFQVWTISILSDYVKPDDDLPEVLKKALAQLQAEKEPPE